MHFINFCINYYFFTTKLLCGVLAYSCTWKKSWEKKHRIKRTSIMFDTENQNQNERLTDTNWKRRGRRQKSLCSTNGSNNTPRCIQKLYHNIDIYTHMIPATILYILLIVISLRASGNAGGLQRYFFISLFFFFSSGPNLISAEPR